ncbi:hypothetical protein EEB12_28285 [Rhodococcus sp. WS1]|uniref:hypothetical protein n=1 Tax=unclassified Rhodococcus (in: high G+C Gram-positive bacteria) TaxID=192944 RepID=UPI0011415C96|nr:MULTISPECIES: hypothetical protein [unclassified Rhodococcus (in: high G+C Gram-positive bacteria)]ROZ52759.1 hypothetical protein EEB12_28285 [Rhodococcus sp. WS1]TQC34282.1 hypothetical protein EEB16_29275 [Rhodococcus sp. WS7]
MSNLTVEQRKDKVRQLHELAEETRRTGIRTPSGKWSVPAEKLIERLYAYAVAVLQDMLANGSIQTQGPRNSRFLYVDEGSLSWLRADHETRHWVASDLIIKTYPAFMEKAIERGDWDGTQSSLYTYFLNACLLRKYEVINKWAKDTRSIRAAALPLAATGGDVDDADASTPDIANHTATKLELTRQIAIAPLKVRPILEALKAGFTLADAARELRISEDAASGRLKRYRDKKIIPLVADGLLDAPSGYFLAKYARTSGAPHATNHDASPRGPFDNAWPPPSSERTSLF